MLCLMALSQTLLAAGISFNSPTALNPHGESMPLLPYLDYYIDETFSVDIDEAAAPSRANFYQPLALGKLPEVEGITWLRFTLAPALPGARQETYLLDMGASIPGTPLLYQPVRNELSGAMEWRETSPAHSEILLLPEQAQEPVVCYIRLAGLPGPWFGPMLRSPQNAASNWGNFARNGAILALGIVAVLCLLRSMGEKGQWRIWTAFYIVVVLLQALLGMPVMQDHFNMQSLCASMAPGLALMLLPHVGRHLMATPLKSKSIDLQLLLLSLPGAAFALAPLWSGLIWLNRWLDLWPMATVLFIPTAIGASLMGLDGSRRFLVGMLLPPIFTAFSYYGMDFGVSAGLLASGPLWGVTISALIIVAMRLPNRPAEQKESRNTTAILPPEDVIINLDHPLDDPHLRIVPQDTIYSDPLPLDNPPLPTNDNFAGGESMELREEALRAPLDTILRECAALGNCALPPTARQYAENILAASQDMANILSDPAYKSPAEATPPRNDIFNLQRLLRDAHDYAISAAERAGIALSWHMPPHLGQLYRGDPEAVAETLKLLVESAVRGTRRGSVHLSARRLPGSEDPGIILFTVEDNGDGTPPIRRSTLAIARAWEAAGKGYFGVEAGPRGVTASFSAHFQPVESEKAEPASTHVILACEDHAQASHLAQILEAIPCRVNEAATIREVLVCQRLDPASLLIACGSFARPSASDMIREFGDLALRAGYPAFHILAITEDDSQWNLLKPSGFTHAMTEPVDPSALTETIRNLCGINDKSNKSGPPPAAPAESAISASDNPGLLDLMESFYARTEEIEKLSSPPADSARENLNRDNTLAEPDADQEIITPAPGTVESNSGIPFEGPDWLAPSVVDSGDIEDSRKTPQSPVENNIYGSPENAGMNLSVAEWVGEPVPIVPANTPERQSVRDEDQLVNSATTEPEPTEELSHSPEEGDKKTVSDAVDGSPDSSVPKYSKDPIINSLLERLDAAMNLAMEGYEHGNSAKVALATATISKQAESFGLRLLSRMALCVERAATANDLGALKDLLPELAMAVERNRIASTQKNKINSP